MKEFYTRKERNHIFSHIPERTLRFWDDSGLTESAREKEDGRGIQREYAPWNLYQVGIVEEMASVNFPVSLIKSTMEKHFNGRDAAGKPKVRQYSDKLFGIAMGRGRKLKRFPYFKFAFGKADNSAELMAKLLEPLELDNIVSQKLFEQPPKPSVVIILNLPEIIEKVNFYVSKAGLES